MTTKMQAAVIREAILRSRLNDTVERVEVFDWLEARTCIEAAQPSDGWHFTDAGAGEARTYECWGFGMLAADGVIDWRLSVSVICNVWRN